MTSDEKVAELRLAITAAVAGLDRDSELGEQVFTYIGLWQMVPGFVRRKIAAALVGALPLQLLEDAVALDDLLGLLAGAALELRSDEPSLDVDVDVLTMQARAHELLEQVRTIAA